jgi:hypothetical protein
MILYHHGLARYVLSSDVSFWAESLIFASNELVQVRSTLKYATEMISRYGLNGSVV